MVSKGRSAILFAFVTCVASRFTPPSGVGVTAASLNVTPNRYIVETSSYSRRSFYDPHRKRDVSFAVNREFNVPEIFVGGVLEINDVSALSGIDGVVSVKPVHRYPAPKPVSLKTLTGPNDPMTPDPLSTHVLTGVDKAHAQGLTGKGITIGILDTGVDYKHPTLGGGFGSGFKVAGGYDFVGDNYDGTNTPVPGSDPLDQQVPLGEMNSIILTHHIGANPGNEYNIDGVAYRIFGCHGSTEDPVIIEALLRGYKGGLDILTLSLGGANGFSEAAASVVASRIAKTGKVITIAAGNDGELGPWYTSAPATGKDVISMGSVDNTITPIQNVTIHVNSEEVAPIPYFSVAPLTNRTTSFEIYATSTNTSSTDDACEPLPKDTPDLFNKVVIIRRGTCTFVLKCEHAAQFGAKPFLIYNDDRPFAAISSGNFTAALIQADTGAFLVNNFAQGKNVTVSFKIRPAELPNSDTGGLMSSFSSLGPSYESDFKPAISAPGGNIVSTLPLNKFGLSSGTSMATPFVAGSVALVLQARGKTPIVALAMRDLLKSTASPIASNLTDAKPLQTLIQAGAGLIQVDRAVNTKTIIQPGHWTLNDTTHFQPTQKFTLTNLGTEPVTYSLAHVPAGTIYTYTGLEVVLPPFELTTDHATVEFSETRLTVNPGTSCTVIAKFTAPPIYTKGYPAYSGHIEIANSVETLRVSYLGVLGSVHKQQLLDHSNDPFNVSLPFVQLPGGTIQNTTTKYTFANGDYPNLVSRLLYGSPQLTVDLVTADSKEGSSPKVVGNIVPGDVAPRTPAGEYLNITIVETFSNGTTIPDGEYRLFLKALKIFGKPDDLKGSETYLSPVVVKMPAPPSNKTRRHLESPLRRHWEGLR
ncbi:subtilisin-like protease [Thelephora ganbajun]|uniref:Subtilisin-like protease n=1 Tax=Thelephora ganbajun TaxID=370292 RepID=A0ACB6ZMN8_THEGA|nr:subtilisin-like protease [Thelephora ganbajun]